MSAHQLIAERVRHLFDYDAEAGTLTRRSKTWPGSRVGEIVGNATDNGYLQLQIDGVKCKAHRVVWLHVTGAWPAGEIDHINGNRADNRIANLRDVPASGNQQNRRPRSDTAHGVMGITRSGSAKKPWRAQIKVPGGKRKYLGLFATQEAASAAYQAARQALHPYSDLTTK